MSSSVSEYKESPSPSLEPASPVSSPRKRRRSSSADSARSRKRAVLTGPYNDAYRLLYNDFVHTLTDTSDDCGPWKTSQLGASIWSSSEKEAFFTALDRLGKDNLPGLAAAVPTKSILEIRRFLIFLEDAALERAGKRDVTLEEIPAATEVSVVCERQLDAAADTLATMQARFEGTQEQKRYGQNWLITSALANEIEVAAKDMRASLPASGDEVDVMDVTSDSPIFQEIPEARLLNPKAFLELSRNVFMNPSANTSYPWPNWQDLVSEDITEPCLYRTAFTDFHTLTVSITKRIMQTALFQATSRIRSQGWRTTKGVKLFVRARDVRTALDLLRMKKSRKQYWPYVPRRCRLRVTHGKYRKLRVFPWDEVERILESTEYTAFTPLDSGTDTEGPISDAEQQAFKRRAARSGTPLPPARQSSSEDSETNLMDLEEKAAPEDNADEEGIESETYPQSEDGEELSDGRETAAEESSCDSTDAEEEGLEALDQETSRQEERKLWAVVGNMPEDLLKAESEERLGKIPRREIKDLRQDWREWTEYHAEWREFRDPVPHASFINNRKSASPTHVWDPATDYETDFATDTGRSSGGEGRNRKSQPKELPLRDPRSYAALRGRQSYAAELDVASDSTEDDADVPAQSIEGVGPGDMDDGVNYD
ncbi:hypothetical protein GRF29_185g638346 [Pseudopithomyces chartarum]|uniref:Uncharacterized protein n=1 Tax=Pseudopithomyces chartarum TaxID=1892770 RepID=A0AAN6RDN7_9PLEO|nr:hypothetical protein GRF29_185g638346 [Pseudopithomyces chartarum]